MKKTIAVILAVCILFSLAACGKKAEEPAPPALGQAAQSSSGETPQPQPQSARPTEEGWLMTRVETPVKLLEYPGMDNDGDWLWLSGNGKLEDAWVFLLLGLDTVSGEWKQMALGLEDLGLGEEYDIRLLTPYELSVCDGMAWMRVGCSNSDHSLWTTRLVTVDIATGSVNATDWAWEKAVSSPDQYLLAFAALDRDRALLVTETEACVIDRAFNPLARNSIEAYMFCSGSYEIGDELYLMRDEGVTRFDPQSLSLGRSLDFKQDGAYFSPANSARGNLLYSSGGKLYAVDSSGQTSLVFDWMDVALSRATMSPTLFENTQGEYYGCAGENGRLALVKVTRAQIPIKDTLTMACFFDTESRNAQPRMTGEMTDAILAFNNADAEYRIEPVWFEYAGEQDLNRALIEAFSAKIDLVDQSNLPEGRVSGSQLLDMLPYLDADPELDRADFFPAAFRGMSIGGRLYRINPYYSPIGFRVLTEDYPGPEQWSCQFLTDAITADHSLAMGQSKRFTSDYIVNTMAHYITAEFIDLALMRCDFMRPDFAAWLSLMDSLIDKSGQAEDKLGFCTNIDGQYLGRSIEALLGDEGVQLSQFVGFPNSQGSGFYLASPVAVVAIEEEYNGANTCLSVAAGCKDGQAAWAFAKLLLQRTQIGLPALRSAFEDLMAFYAGSYGMSQEDIDALRDIAENAAGTVLADPALILLIRGELNAYLHGEKSAEAVAEQLQSRVGIYLAEQG